MSQKIEAFIKMPMSLLDNKDLSIIEKVLYSIVLNLTNRTGICTASNSYLADKLNVSIRTIDRTLKTLEDNKLITRNSIYEENTKKVVRRDIKILATNLVKGIDILSNDIDKNGKGGTTNLVKGIDTGGVVKRQLKEEYIKEDNAPFHFASLSVLMKDLKTKADLKKHKPFAVIKQFDDYLNTFEYQTDEDKQIVDYVLDIGYSFIKYRDYMYNITEDKKYSLLTKQSVKTFIDTVISEYSHIELETLFDKLESKGWATIEKGWKI